EEVLEHRLTDLVVAHPHLATREVVHVVPHLRPAVARRPAVRRLRRPELLASIRVATREALGVGPVAVLAPVPGHPAAVPAPHPARHVAPAEPRRTAAGVLGAVGHPEALGPAHLPFLLLPDAAPPQHPAAGPPVRPATTAVTVIVFAILVAVPRPAREPAPPMLSPLESHPRLVSATDPRPEHAPPRT